MLRLTTIIILLASGVAAHVPVLSIEKKTAEMPYDVEDAEHSLAIYAILDGEPHYYRIKEDQPFDFYVGLTAPKLSSCDLQTTFNIDVLNDQLELIDTRNGAEFDWWAWFEEFGKQWYWIGPEIGEDFKSTTIYPAGTYYIRVYNSDNTGKYVLAIGDDERFGLKTLLTLRKTVRETERIFWDEADCEQDLPR